VYDERYLHLPVGQLIDLLRTRPDAILSVEMGLRTALALLYGTLTRTPVWVWWGGTLHTERDLDRARRLVRAVISRWAKRWISYGASSTEYLLSLGVPRDRILQIQNCVDETLFTAHVRPGAVETAAAGGSAGTRPGARSAGAVRPTRSAAADEPVAPRPVFLHVGQLIGRKGVDALLDAAAIVQREGRSFSLLLVGDGPEREALEARAAALGLRNVHFRPGRPPAEMPAVYRSGDFLVFPTRADVWGLVVNEALWSGVPVLASIHAGCAAELLPPEQLFDPDDPADLAAALHAALDGRVGPPDTSRLMRCAEVGDLIADEIEGALGGAVA
jgi:glycosyltransferase involved in cell wall biosynthesis